MPMIVLKDQWRQTKELWMFLNQGQFSHPKDIARYEDMFGCHILGECYWHPMGRG